MKQIQLISFENPYPPINGGLIDVYYLIKALVVEGQDVVLHTFYTEPLHKADELEAICSKVFYYRRVKSVGRLLSKVPFIVHSRKDETLVKRISEIGSPVLLEGIHCCSVLGNSNSLSVPVYVRTHNVEHDYYRSLMRLEKRAYYRWYLKAEAKKLEKFEKVLAKANGLFALSSHDEAHFKKINTRTELIPVFHGNNLSARIGKGDYVLYQGNLAVAENHFSAIFLIKEVFNNLQIPLVIAGSNPRKELVDQCSKNQSVKLVSNPNQPMMRQLIEEAQVNLLPSFTRSGIKLKLINALFLGRHCITNSQMLEGSGLEKCCTVYSDVNDLKDLIRKKFAQAFSLEDLNHRSEILGMNYSDEKNAKKLIGLMSLDLQE